MTSTSSPIEIAGENRGAHLGYLDGIRGLAALYVLVEHAQMTGLDYLGARELAAGTGTSLEQFARLLNATVLGYGHFAVNVFIVLSGYCLMLPVARSADQKLRGGLKGYVKRRSLRILPPYYAALIVSIFVYMIYNGGNLPAGGQLISHAFLVHNATAEWLHGISAPLWSVAVEWQIYFVFALLLLPIWRTLGGVAVIVAAMLIGVGPLYVLPTGRNLEWFCPWYVVLFAMGMLAAAAGVVAKADGYHRRWNVYAIIAGVFTIVAFLLPELGGEFWARALRMEHRGASWLLDVGVGITVSFGLMSLTQSVMSGNGALNLRIVRTLQSKPIALLGAFSYSLYLIHAPLIALLALGIHRMQLSPLVGYVTLYAVGIPLGLTGAFLFYLAIERHCMGGRRATRPARKTGQDVFAEPAAGASAVQV